MLVTALQDSPPKPDNAKQYFGYLSMHSVSELFDKKQLEQLSSMKFVPVSDTNYLEPVQCYLGQPTPEFYRDLFTFVDFGISSNPFLQMCGSKDEATVNDIGKALARDPQRFLDVSGGYSQ